MPQWRNLVCGIVIITLPVAVLPQDTARAILHSDGSVWVNGNAITTSSALFPHDVVQTPKDVVAKIDAEGSTAIILPETVLQFEGDEIVLDHGSLQLKTNRQLRVRVNCMTMIPVLPEWTQFDVTDVDGKVTVAANQKDVKIHILASTPKQAKDPAAADVIVHESEKKTRDEHCGGVAQSQDAIPAKIAFLNTTWVKFAAGGLIAATCYLICRGDDPISPDKP